MGVLNVENHCFYCILDAESEYYGRCLKIDVKLVSGSEFRPAPKSPPKKHSPMVFQKENDNVQINVQIGHDNVQTLKTMFRSGKRCSD